MVLQLSAPMRPDEVRLLLLKDFRGANRHERGQIFIRASKTEAGAERITPLDQEAESALRQYINFERPAFNGKAPDEFHGHEPLFLSDDGSGFKYAGWTRRNQILKRALQKAGVQDFVQYRSR